MTFILIAMNNWGVSISYILILWHLSSNIFTQSSSYQGKFEPRESKISSSQWGSTVLLTLATSSHNFSVYYHSHTTCNPLQNIATSPLGLQYSGKAHQVYPRYLKFHLPPSLFPPSPIFCKCTTMNEWRAALWQTEVNISCHFVMSS